MASTNKTTHYELSQYIGTDKPTYLVDYNTDMLNIDAGIYDAKNEADTNSASIGNLSNLETSVKTDLVSAVNEVSGKTDDIGNLSNLTTENTSSIVGAINEVDANSKTNNQNIGNMTNLETTVKSSLVGAVNEVNSKTTPATSFVESTDKSYSTTYINDGFGRVLYEAPTPLAPVSVVELNDLGTNYDMCEVFYSLASGGVQQSLKCKLDYYIALPEITINQSNEMHIRATRYILGTNADNHTTLTFQNFEDKKIVGTTLTATNSTNYEDSTIIITKVIGYKHFI